MIIMMMMIIITIIMTLSTIAKVVAHLRVCQMVVILILLVIS